MKFDAAGKPLFVFATHGDGSLDDMLGLVLQQFDNLPNRYQRAGLGRWTFDVYPQDYLLPKDPKEMLECLRSFDGLWKTITIV
jgi:hypothetical protein